MAAKAGIIEPFNGRLYNSRTNTRTKTEWSLNSLTCQSSFRFFSVLEHTLPYGIFMRCSVILQEQLFSGHATFYIYKIDNYMNS